MSEAGERFLGVLIDREIELLKRAGFLNLPEDSAERKKYPIYSGVFKYFPLALAAVSKLSYDGNQKHNPGEPLHWSRDKSNDHLDCIARHLLQVGTYDENGVLHDVMLAWRALANAQIALEKAQAPEALPAIAPPSSPEDDIPF